MLNQNLLIAFVEKSNKGFTSDFYFYIVHQIKFLSFDISNYFSSLVLIFIMKLRKMII